MKNTKDRRHSNYFLLAASEPRSTGNKSPDQSPDAVGMSSCLSDATRVSRRVPSKSGRAGAHPYRTRKDVDFIGIELVSPLPPRLSATLLGSNRPRLSRRFEPGSDAMWDTRRQRSFGEPAGSSPPLTRFSASYPAQSFDNGWEDL